VHRHGFETGLYAFETLKLRPVAGRRGHRSMTPHVNVWLSARGINVGLSTRMFFADELGRTLPIRSSTSSSRARREMLIARSEETAGEVVYVFDIHLEGERETVFFDI
jgi:protocatechuate 3,4-dioxygenase, alpha subunit